MYTLSGGSLSEKKAFQAGKEVVKAEFSPDGATLAVSSGRSVFLYDTASYQVYTQALALALALSSLYSN